MAHASVRCVSRVVAYAELRTNIQRAVQPLHIDLGRRDLRHSAFASWRLAAAKAPDVNGSHTGIVYVLSSDDQWTKYLDAGDHLVSIVSTKDVTRGQSVMDRREWKNLTTSEVVAGW